jgi:1,4-alpha-glucan branching enzyme
MSASARGDLLLLLHAHLPYVRHPENPYHLEENWLYEAITATYLPLLLELHKLLDGGASPRLTLSLSPTLCSMLRDKLLGERYRAYLDRLLRLGEDELTRAKDSPAQAELARFYLARFTELRAHYLAIDGDIVAAYAQLQERGAVEIITTCATHAYLPVLREPSARRAQLLIAVRHYRECFGRYPRGIWLPECGYVDGLDQLLAELNLRFFFLDAHGLTYARPRPPLGLHAPIFTRAGVAAFGRDLMSSKQVWSSTEGYPADGVYRDFYRDIGFDRPLSEIAPYIHPDGIRVHTGYKYHRVTGPRVDLQDKALYEPEVARLRAREHARDFVEKRQAQVAWLSQRLDRRPIIVSPYDAELFGHWWFEGPTFLAEVLRLCSQPGSPVQLQTASGYLADYTVNAVCDPAPSSWGEGGYSAVWLDSSNDWIYRHVHHAESKMHELVAKFGSKEDAAQPSAEPSLISRALVQAGRELLLSQSSDWAFIMKTGTAVSYAESRVRSHLQRFGRLATELEAGTIDESFLAECEARDNLFPHLDPRLF